VYLEFYELKKRPFDMTPDPAFFFPSQRHSEALASLIYAVKEKRGFVVITGEIGSGKTTVCRTLLQRLDPAAKVAMLTNTTLTARQLLEAVCIQFGLPAEKQNKVSLLNKLNRFFLEQNDSGSTVVLIVDEAQNLSVKALEEIRLISNMETDTQKLVQIMLLGQPELRDKLSRPDLEQLRQRVSLRYHLSSLDKEETRCYVEHRLNIAGDDGKVKFTKGAIESLYEFSGGVPRLINVVCDQALLMGYLRETRKIDESIVREIAAEFSFAPAGGGGREASDSTTERPRKFWRFLGRRRASPERRMGTSPVASPPPVSEPPDGGPEESAPLTEDEILTRLAELRLGRIWAENGYFVAALDGVHLRAGDRLFGMEVVQVDREKIAFRFGEKRYEMAIENCENSGGPGPASPEEGAAVNTEKNTMQG